MKKILASIAIFGLLAAIIAPTYAQKPEKAQGPHEILTGDVTASAGGTSLTVNITAHDTNPAKGDVSYSNSKGGNFEGNVDCYQRNGGIVVVGGSINPGGTYSQSRFGVEIDLVNNKIRVPVDESYNCDFSNKWGGIITENNLVLHEVPVNTPEPGTQPVAAKNKDEKPQGETHRITHAKHLYLYEKDTTEWEVVSGGAWGKLNYDNDSYVFNGHGLVAGEEYALINYQRNGSEWPASIYVLGTGYANEGSNIHLMGEWNQEKFDYDTTPHSDTGGFKIWLVKFNDIVDGKLSGWNPTEYLFENNLINFDVE